MRLTLQPRLQGSFKHGNHRKFHSMIMQVCEFDFLRFTALDHEAMCVGGTPVAHRRDVSATMTSSTLFMNAQDSTYKARKVYVGG
jgi:hypothetical protein